MIHQSLKVLSSFTSNGKGVETTLENLIHFKGLLLQMVVKCIKCQINVIICLLFFVHHTGTYMQYLNDKLSYTVSSSLTGFV